MEEGRAVYATNCAACHGENADGGEQGPNLVGMRSLRSRTAQQLASFIRVGRPTAGMPGFPLPDAQLNAVAEFIHSLNSPASENPVAGNASAGREFFFGKGQCFTCHTAEGRGRAVGPDLSNAGREMTAAEMRLALTAPAQHVPKGYKLVSVKLRDGSTVRGFERGRTNFDIQIQGIDGRFHLLKSADVTQVIPEKDALMKPAPAEAIRDLIAYLSGLTGVRADVVAAPEAAGPGGIDFARIAKPHPGDWLTYNGTLDGNRYSDLKQINTANVNGLAVKWMFPIDHFGLEVTPLVADGVMYITGPNQAFALDALTGRQLWHYGRPRTAGLIGDASLGTNRGLAILGDHVFMVTDNAHLIALNRITGAMMWDATMPEEPMHYGGTVAPLIVNDTVIAGVAGGDRGIRGFLACYQASTGALLWRKYTIPFKGMPGAETWGEKQPTTGGGATWLTGAYDAASDTLYWPTGNPYPDSDDRDRPGDNLYSNCILAINPKTGEVKWHFQFTPHDIHDWDATEPPLLVDTKYQGSDRKLLLHADRNGFFYVLDRTNGKLLLAKQFIRDQTWTSGIAPDGRPQPPVDKSPALDCPTDGANWNSAAYSPVTRLEFVLTHESCRVNRRPGAWKESAKVTPAQKFVRAIRIDDGKVAWEIPLIGDVFAKTWPGILATAGGLVFYGDPNGAFAAADERDGKTLWQFSTNVYMKASPMTFMVDGRQYVATVAGPNIVCFGLPSP
jgi:PQQ-dependent dehydrogenase (methanol/ethanol family)